MTRYSKTQALSLARQIAQRFGAEIREVCAGSDVPPEFLAALISIEAGKDRRGQLDEDATRFEAGVFADLKSLRDNGYCWVSGRKRNDYSGVRRAQIADASDAALRALSRSYGLTQIMGWHGLNSLKCTVEDLRNPDKHLGYTVRLLQLGPSGEYLARREFAPVLRIWNTGSPHGRTYHPAYVENGLNVMAAWRDVAADTAALADGDDGAEATVWEEPTEASSDTASAFQTADAASAPAPSGDTPGTPATQISQGWRSRLYAALGSAPATIAAIKGILADNALYIVLGVACVTTIVLALIFRNLIMDYLRVKIAADPNQYNAR